MGIKLFFIAPLLFTFLVCNAQLKPNISFYKSPGVMSHVITSRYDSLLGKVKPDTIIVGDTVFLVKHFIKSITKLKEQKEELITALCLPQTLNLTFKSEKDKKKYYRILKENGILTKKVKLK